MSHADRDPHVLISARIGSSQKMLLLPSHRARWGWIVTLGQAKLQRPPGIFESLAQLRFLAGEFRDCVTPWLDAKLLHAVPFICERCTLAYGTVALPSVVVHDFIAHQERKSRTTEWRNDNGVPNGHANLTGNPSGNDGETPGETLSPRARTPVRADAGALHSLSPSSTPSTGDARDHGIDADEAALFTYLAQHGAAIRPESGLGRRLVGLVGRRGAAPVMAKAIALGAAGNLSDRQWVFGLEDALEAVPDGKAIDRTAELAKQADHRNRGVWARRIEAYRAGGQWDPAWGEPPAAA